MCGTEARGPPLLAWPVQALSPPRLCEQCLRLSPRGASAAGRLSLAAALPSSRPAVPWTARSPPWPCSAAVRCLAPLSPLPLAAILSLPWASLSASLLPLLLLLLWPPCASVSPRAVSRSHPCRTHPRRCGVNPSRASVGPQRQHCHSERLQRIGGWGAEMSPKSELIPTWPTVVRPRTVTF